LVSIAVCELISSVDYEIGSNLLKPLLYSDNEKVRIRAMIFFAARCTREELELLLADCAERQGRYYDVVCFFDRLLYAPPTLRRNFFEVAKKELFNLCQNVDFAHLEAAGGE
jgi:hypothetical protein